MIIGNSVAYFLAADGFSTLRSDPQLTTLNLGRVGCTEPPPDALRLQSGEVTEEFIDSCDGSTWKAATDTFHPTNVIFTRNALGDIGYRHDGKWLRPCSDEFRAWSVGRLEGFARTFTAAGASFVLVTSPPDGLILTEIGNDRTEQRNYLRAVACGNDELREVARRHPDTVELVDLTAAVCPDPAKCVHPSIDGVNLRPDGTHFKGVGAQLVAQFVLKRLGIVSEIPGNP